MSTPRAWAGDRRRQEWIAKDMLKRYRGDTPIDVAGACETLILNMLLGVSSDYEVLCDGVDKIAGDLKDALKRGITQ